MTFYKSNNNDPHKTSLGEGVGRVMTLVEAGFPMGQIPFINIRIPAGHPVQRMTDGNTGVCFPYNFFPNPDHGYIIEVEGDSMIGSNIENGDLLLVDGSASPKHRDIVIASINGEMTVKRYLNRNEYVVFAPENDDYSPIIATNADELDIFGVVIRIIKSPQ